MGQIRGKEESALGRQAEEALPKGQAHTSHAQHAMSLQCMSILQSGHSVCAIPGSALVFHECSRTKKRRHVYHLRSLSKLRYKFSACTAFVQNSKEL